MPKPTRRRHQAVHRRKMQLHESTGIAKQVQSQGLVSSGVLLLTAGWFGGRSPEVRGWFMLWNRKFQKNSLAFLVCFFQLLFQLLKLPVEQANTSCCSIRISCTQEFRLRTHYAFTTINQQASLLPAGWLLVGDTHSASEWNKNPGSGETEKP